ncbi:SUMF1/EgtB/PvdO family nonheme iron enzyme [Stieleria maiorica]|uniref:SUMF1/EgtB/PvdO family nonheme iron enzyme n=1 Tax=Stieleria maiorica TaxID=2795974 RepID=UPI001F328823|nr:SUMF1/EgtB/PvdO family nonheme iron enzyme [Stieleria maiorica]
MIAVGVCCGSAFLVAQDSNAPHDTAFRFIEGGRFVQGTDGGERALQQAFPLSTTGQSYGNAEGPAHVTWVTNPFYIAETEVTVGQFRRFVDATGYQTTAERGMTEMVGWEPTPDDKPLYQSHDFLRDQKFSWKNPGFPQGDDHPIVGVSLTDARAYCQWLSQRDGVRYRLPTEAEWELVCRAGTTTWFSFGDVAKGVVHEHANLGNVELERHRKHAAERQWLLDWEHDPSDGHVFTAPVGSYARNPWGIADMHGNVWEWCEDLWLDTVYKDYTRPRYDQPCGVAVDPVNRDRPQTTNNDFHVIRGGCWYNGDLICRSSARTAWDADDAACYVGFRIVREADPATSTTVRDAYEAEQAAIAAIEAAGGKLFSSHGIDLEVRLEGSSVDETVFEQLAKLPDLQRLRIGWRGRDARLSQQGLDAIARLHPLRTLEFNSGLGLETLDLSVLTRLTQLNTLRFPRDGRLDDDHLKSLSGFKSLTEFECYGATEADSRLTDVGIGCLSGNGDLETLLVWENQATGAYLKSLANCPLSSLASTAPDRHPGAMNDAGATNLSLFPGLQALTLDGQTLLGKQAMLQIAELRGLQRLSLQRCTGIPDAEMSALEKLQQLRNVNLSESTAGDIAATALGTIPRLESLRLGSEASADQAGLSDAGVAALSAAFSIRDLQLASNALTDRGLKQLGRINRLERLTISSDQITGSGLGPLTELPDLRDLSLRTPGLRDAAFEYLARAKSVRKLWLANRGIRPAAALTNDGMIKLAKATWLQELWLPRNGTGITEDQINALNDQMPKTNVIAYTVSWD